MIDINESIGICDVIRIPKTADSMTVTTGTLTSGTVADTRVWADGNSVEITEVTGVPGFDVRFTFINVMDFCFLGASAYYTGATASHFAEYQIYDDANTAWRTLFSFQFGSSQNYRFADLPVPAANIQDYINSSKQVITRFYHPTTGNNSHDLFIGYASLIG